MSFVVQVTVVTTAVPYILHTTGESALDSIFQSHNCGMVGSGYFIKDLTHDILLVMVMEL